MLLGFLCFLASGVGRFFHKQQAQQQQQVHWQALQAAQQAENQANAALEGFFQRYGVGNEAALYARQAQENSQAERLALLEAWLAKQLAQQKQTDAYALPCGLGACPERFA